MANRVEITTYRGRLIIDTINHEEHPDWEPIGPGQFCCVLIDTGKHLGISAEALDQLRREDVGWALCWFSSPRRGWCLQWWGAPNRFIGPDRSRMAQDHQIAPDTEYTLIPNEPPAPVVAMIDYGRRAY